MVEPISKSFKWKIDGENLPDVFVHIVDFPEANLWIWIGENTADLKNLSLALNSSRKSGSKPVSTPILNPTISEEGSNSSKILAQKLSTLLKGRPVFLSYSLPDYGPMEDLLCLPDFEAQLFKLLKSK